MSTDGEAPPNDPRAQSAMRRAHGASYRLPSNFPGFWASLNFNQETDSQVGDVTLRSPGEIELEILIDPESRTWLERQLASIGAHLWPRPFDEAEGADVLGLLDESGHALGRGITSTGGQFESLYRIRNDDIVQIERKSAEVHFSMLIQARVNLADGRSLPSHFTVFTWDVETGRLAGTDVYEDRYTEVEGLYLPTMRRVVTADDGGSEARVIELSEHRILT